MLPIHSGKAYPRAITFKHAMKKIQKNRIHHLQLCPTNISKGRIESFKLCHDRQDLQSRNRHLRTNSRNLPCKRIQSISQPVLDFGTARFGIIRSFIIASKCPPFPYSVSGATGGTKGPTLPPFIES